MSETKHSTLSVFDSLTQALWITALFWIVHPFGGKKKTTVLFMESQVILA